MRSFLHFVGALLFLGGLSYVLVAGAPRIWRDAVHADKYVPAREHTFVDYKCKNWNLFMFNECTSTYTSNKTKRSEELTDWRFGWSPDGGARLLEWKSDPTVVTTDASVATIINRSILYLTGCLLVLLIALGAVMMLRNAVSGGQGAAPVDPQR